MKVKTFFLTIFVIAVSVLIYYFRSVPTGQLWNDYTVFYVSDDVEDEFVTEAFQANGIKEFVSLNGQGLPVMIEEGSLADTMFKLNISGNNSEYLQRRTAYFFDSTKAYRIYYIPNKYKDRIEKTVKTLDSVNISAGVDSSVAFPWILPVIVGIAALVLLFCVRAKLLFFFVSIVPVLFVFCNPFYSCAAAAILVLLAMLYICNLWYRDGAAKKLAKNPFIYGLVVLAITAAFASSVFAGLYFLLVLLAQASVVLIFMNAKLIKLQSQTYTFVSIRPIKMISIYAGKAKFVFPVLLLAIIGIFFSYRYYSNNSSNIKSHYSKILLPGEAEEHNESFPKLTELCRWNWDIMIYPYMSLNTEYESTDRIVYPRYTSDETGIHQEEEVLEFNSDYCKSIYSNIENLDFNNIEHVVKSQGIDFNCGYTTAKNYHVSLFSIITIILSFCMLLFIYFSAIIKKGGRK